VRELAALPWYVLLLGYAQILAVYAGNAMSVVALVRPLAVFTLAATLLTAGLALVLRRWDRAGLVVAFALLLFRTADVVGSIATIFLAIGAAAVVALTIRQLRVADGLRRATRVLNTLASALMVVMVVNVAISARGGEILEDLSPGIDLGTLEGKPAAERIFDPSRPDVYVIMLDGYPRRDTLDRLFDFDNSSFIQGLEERGLNVAERSRSNYMYTALTLTSMLHMRHIADVEGIDGEDSLRLRINHNPTFDAFRDRGYIVMATAAGWESNAMRSADVFCGAEVMNDFELNLVGHSLAGRLIVQALPSYLSDRDRASVNTTLDCINRAAALNLAQPRLLFAHVPSPHLPVVFDRDGSAAAGRLYGHHVEDIRAPYAEFAQAYARQLEYINGRVLEAVDTIQRSSRTPPVIVVFSDHGSESHLDWDDALRSDLDERFSNFFAASTPGADLFGEAPTPVILFSTLLNHYFDAGIPLAGDESYVSRVQDRLGLSPAPPGVGGP
jgi:hypothetical protein